MYLYIYIYVHIHYICIYIYIYVHEYTHGGENAVSPCKAPCHERARKSLELRTRTLLGNSMRNSPRGISDEMDGLSYLIPDDPCIVYLPTFRSFYIHLWGNGLGFINHYKIPLNHYKIPLNHQFPMVFLWKSLSNR